MFLYYLQFHRLLLAKKMTVKQHAEVLDLAFQQTIPFWTHPRKQKCRLRV